MPKSARETVAGKIDTVLSFIENKIDGYLANFSTDDVLTISALSVEVSSQLNVKLTEASCLITMYCSERDDIEIRTGRNGGLYPVGHKADKKGPVNYLHHPMYSSIKDIAEKLIPVKFELAEKVAKASSSEARVNVQELCGEIADELKIKSYVAYFCFREYITHDRKDLRIQLGRYGGLMKSVA